MRSMIEVAREILRGTGWTVESESVLTCPCGRRIEWDGECPECGPTPIRRRGLI